MIALLFFAVAYAVGWVAGYGPLRLVRKARGLLPRRKRQLPAATAREIRRERKAGRLVLK
jgi:hypothetical protein